MPKPKKKRIVQSPPTVDYFKPRGIPMSRLEQVILTLDEYETLRLVDGDGQDQAEAAVHLGVSRATCARILESAHKKIAEAITRGKAIQIQGGCFDFRHSRLICDSCGHSWELPAENSSGNPDTEICPSCGSTDVSDLADKFLTTYHQGRGHGHGRGRNGNRF